MGIVGGGLRSRKSNRACSERLDNSRVLLRSAFFVLQTRNFLFFLHGFYITFYKQIVGWGLYPTILLFVCIISIFSVTSVFSVANFFESLIFGWQG